MSSLNRLTAHSLDHNKFIIPIRKGVEIVQKPAFLKNNFVLFLSGSDTTTPPFFLLIFLGLCTYSGELFFRIMFLREVKFTTLELS